MLSFLREQGNANLPAQKPDAASGAPGDVAETSQEQEYLTVAAHGKRARKSTTLLAVLFIMGLLCLWFMIKKSTPQVASAAAVDAEQTQVEAAIARLTGVKSEMFSSMDEIVRKFYEFSDVLQVQVGELVKNPFRLETFLAGLKEEPDVEIKAPEIDAEKLWQQQIRQKADSMELLSIMKTDQGTCCMIGNNILYEGDSTKDFTVRQIGDSFVKLEWDSKRDDGRLGAQPDNVEIILKLSE
ncbi:MAG: hypothetical protein PVJ86_13675 [Phycisphaerales bacterium]|jgi:hypothetical protein